ncbi:phenylalanine--tRNA ligase subunit alpha [Candidatus Woesearchaeota archaeon]|nr:phenylalanine--tRNA ligase subunit alpha [Candidatus Woesearchaeota archaeon]
MEKIDIKKIISSLNPVEQKVLPLIKDGMGFAEITNESGLKEIESMRALQWLQNKGIVKLDESSISIIHLDKNGKKYIKDSLPERKFLNSISGSMPLSKIVERSGIEDDEVNICLGKLKRSAAIDIRKDKDLIISLTANGEKLKGKESLEEIFLKKAFPVHVDDLSAEEKFAAGELMKRKGIIRKDESKAWTIRLTKAGKDVQRSAGKGASLIEKLTPEIIKSEKWKHTGFRRYDVSINVPKISGGSIHFVEQAVRYIRKIWLELGFVEMEGSIVQTAFWDLDSLFVPQDHPARDMQDTFYIKDPSSGKIPGGISNRIKTVHENGGDTGSRGWRQDWSVEKAKENLLRTHTTVLSAQAISRIKETGMPAKFFSVKRVYRNETLSWKHLFEFVQVEGIVVDPNMNFVNLNGYLREFFAKMGFSDIRIRPGHFPYTEPSAEVEGWHPEKKQWIELGGSGIFRPEVTKPLIGKEIPVLAWGLGMERTIMEYYKIRDIRELYKNDLKQLREIKAWMR